ncbi:putative lipid II flippase FtsW [uncultured Thiothrix sp.]|jgi:cell division protein FtsW|uniref:putative lipid II flippase FtsW n=1 Tax=uncultured Thiothrix sp. TaxID=223185 RepID=UPI002608F1F7|nr:putative lipid II flippase FtsW [uncultured Thiothrix sp.]HMT91836.1 putative lipid II flippase FtsW [Thiolinea sp.]
MKTISPLNLLERIEAIDWSRYIDRDLALAIVALLAIGVVMLGSASFWVAEKGYGDMYYLLKRQLLFLGLALVLAFVLYQVRIGFWEGLGVKLLPIAVFLLVLVLIPGIGVSVKGSRRWLALGPVSLQVSELVKIIMIMYLSSYMVRHGKKLSTSISYQPLVLPLIVLAVIGALLLLEPDFGSAVIVIMVGLALLFLGGVPLKRLGLFLGGAMVLMLPIVALEGYRLRRIEAFLNPWADIQNSGYQIINSLIAIGDGGWFGNGLGAGVQKLYYLPEAHNDFIFAVLAEEFGFVGMILLLALFGWLVYRAFVIGFNADKQGLQFGAYVAYGIGFWMGFQVILHIGVNLAVLPPKGLTLPFLSYGGSSLLITLLAMSLLMRIHRDTQVSALGLAVKTTARKTPVHRTVGGARA